MNTINKKVEELEAIILCGGNSWRLKPRTFTPKPMLEFGNKTLLEHQISWLLSNKINRILIASDKEYEIHPLLEPAVTWCIDQQRGTGGAILLAADELNYDRFYLMNVDDVIFGFQPRLLAYPDCEARILVAKPFIGFGRVELRQDLVIGFKEKPLLNFWVSTGHYFFKKHIVSRYFPDYGNLEEEVLPKLAKKRILQSQRLHGKWIPINNYKDYQAAKLYI